MESSIAKFHLWLYIMQDDFAIQSFERGIAAQESGSFAREIIPVGNLLIS